VVSAPILALTAAANTGTVLVETNERSGADNRTHSQASPIGDPTSLIQLTRGVCRH
jgi:hypothetical protein